jgi:hypothetical protein
MALLSTVMALLSTVMALVPTVMALVPTVMALVPTVMALLSSVNSFCLTFFKAGCLGYLYLTGDVYNSHFCHLKFYPQNRLYFQNITNERKSNLFILHKVHTVDFVPTEIINNIESLHSAVRSFFHHSDYE